jgi:hypothetical protein
VDIVLALVAAFFFALGLVLQEKAASQKSADDVGAGFLVRLVQEPVWLLGFAAQGLGFAAQAVALAIEWVGALVVTGGLAALLIVSKTSEGSDDASLGVWLAVGGACVGIALVLYLLARGRSPALRAGLLGTAAGILFGFAAALTKATMSRFDEGILDVVWDWHLYALIAVSVAAFWLQQAALQTGALSAAVASNMAFDPLSSIPLGIIIFDEQLHETTLGITVSLLALGVTLFGLVLLARAKGAGPPVAARLQPAPAAG